MAAQQAPGSKGLEDLSPREGFLKGVRVGSGFPAIVLFATALGFGVLARDAGFGLTQSLFMSGAIFAMPNQVMLVDQLTRNETLAITALAVALTAMRLLPMTVTLAPLLDRPRRHLGFDLLLSHFVTISTWLEGNRHLPKLGPRARVPFFLGVGGTILVALMIGTALGYVAAANVPQPIITALLFATPVYFFLSLVATSRLRADFIAVGAGAALIPLVHAIAPGFDLLGAGVAGGTLAFFARRT
ncbi:MAG: branched-chain amino acid ABC transporter permease [Hyphomicrobiales bacterium]|nr:MAG: branched-chain amino acid ABC transporter permease [Hyphomicrobiales bacterium]